MKSAELLKSNPSNSICIRYEDIVLDSIQTLGYVYKFLGLETLSEESLKNDLSQVRFKRTGSIYDKPFSDTNPRPVGIQLEGLTRWQDQLTAEQKQIILKLTWRCGNYFNYPLPRCDSTTAWLCFRKIPLINQRIKQIVRWISATLQLVLLTSSRSKIQLGDGIAPNKRYDEWVNQEVVM